MKNEGIGARAKARREELGLSRTELARRVEAAGRPNTRIQNIRQLEEGDVQSITYLAELSIALECDAVWLATGRMAKPPLALLQPHKMLIAHDAANAVIDAHKLKLDREQRMALALEIYRDISDDFETPEVAAKAALLRFLADRQRQ